MTADDLPPAVIQEIGDHLLASRRRGWEAIAFVFLADVGPSADVAKALAATPADETSPAVAAALADTAFDLLCTHAGRGGRVACLEIFSHALDPHVWLVIIEETSLHLRGILRGDLAIRKRFDFEPAADDVHDKARERLRNRFIAHALITDAIRQKGESEHGRNA